MLGAVGASPAGEKGIRGFPQESEDVQNASRMSGVRENQQDTQTGPAQHVPLVTRGLCDKQESCRDP